MEMIRILFFAAILISGVAVKAQSPLAMDGTPPVFRNFNQVADTNGLRKKWFVTTYSGISTGFMAFKGGSSTFLSAPLALQVNRQLTNNLVAFGNVAVTPSVSHYNSVYYQPGFKDNTGLMNSRSFGAYSTAQMGLMYINNQRTFSISGSIGVSRGSYNGYSPFYTSPNAPVFRSTGNNY